MSCVEPKKDCGHIPEKIFKPFPKGIRYLGCKECGVRGENWFCLTCGVVLCGRYCNAHMAEHYQKTKHPVACSFTDLSFWCYEDSSYILHSRLSDMYNHLHIDKFGYEPPKTIEEGIQVEEKIRKERPQIDTTEYFDDEKELSLKIKKAAEMLLKSSFTILFSGAGLSTSAKIPDYRGPNGIWTLDEKGIGLDTLEKVDLETTNPTFAHIVIADLMKKGHLQYVVSTNVDGLHLKSGISLSKISELHGNVFKEKCTKCKRAAFRKYDTTKTVMKELDEKNRKNHLTQRQCEHCGGNLKDSIIHFTEPLDSEEVSKAIEVSISAEVCLILGTSMRVSPANKFPFMGKKSKTILVNLQKTPCDEKIDLKVYCKIDKFMKLLIKEMGIKSL